MRIFGFAKWRSVRGRRLIPFLLLVHGVSGLDLDLVHGSAEDGSYLLPVGDTTIPKANSETELFDTQSQLESETDEQSRMASETISQRPEVIVIPVPVPDVMESEGRDMDMAAEMIRAEQERIARVRERATLEDIRGDLDQIEADLRRARRRGARFMEK